MYFIKRNIDECIKMLDCEKYKIGEPEILTIFETDTARLVKIILIIVQDEEFDSMVFRVGYFLDLPYFRTQFVFNAEHYRDIPAKPITADNYYKHSVENGVFEMSILDSNQETNTKTWKFQPEGVLKITNSVNMIDGDEIIIPKEMTDVMVRIHG